MYNLSNLDRSVVLFEIDNPTPVRNARFARFLSDSLVMGAILHPFEQGMGRYKGEINPCFVMANSDFHNLLSKGLAQYVKEQESILLVDTDGSASLIYADHRVEKIGEIFATRSMSQAHDFTLLKSGFFTVM